jgi:hypothetical protein
VHGKREQPGQTENRVDPVRLRYVLVIAGLVAGFYCLASIVIGRMPFTWTPAWWMGIWPSRKVAVYLWFGVLNAVGAVIAAIPVSLLLRWLVEGNRVRAAFTVGVPAAVLMTGSVVVHYSPLSRASVLMAAELFLVVLLSVPFLVWVIGALVSKSGSSSRNGR